MKIDYPNFMAESKMEVDNIDEPDSRILIRRTGAQGRDLQRKYGFVVVGVGIALGIEIAKDAHFEIDADRASISIPGFCDISSIFETETR